MVSSKLLSKIPLQNRYEALGTTDEAHNEIKKESAQAHGNQRGQSLATKQKHSFSDQTFFSGKFLASLQLKLGTSP